MKLKVNFMAPSIILLSITSFAWAATAAKTGSEPDPGNKTKTASTQHPVGYSLWLMPSGEERDQYQRSIDRYSSQNSFASFEPHITLLGQFKGAEDDLIDQTKKLAGELEPFKAQFKSVHFVDSFYGALLLLAELSAPLKDAYGKAQRIFSPPTKEKAPYLPHLSLLYDQHHRLSAAEKVNLLNVIQEQIGKTVFIDTLHLFKTDGPVETWFRVKEFKLENH